MIKLLILLSIFKFSINFLTNTKQEIIESFNKELNIKHLNILKDFNFQIDHKILLFVKKLSDKNIYFSALSSEEINNLLHDFYYYLSPADFLISLESKSEDLNSKRNLIWRQLNSVYPPKTLVIIYGENTEENIYKLFNKENEIKLPKFIWLFMDNHDEFYKYLKYYYIPYNSQLLVLKSATDAENNYTIQEFYHPSITSQSWFERHFGIWEKYKGLEIFEHDIFKRRLDLNGTIVGAFTEGIVTKNCINLEIQECVLIYEISKIMNFELVIMDNLSFNKSSKTRNLNLKEIFLDPTLINILSYYPFNMDPHRSTKYYFHIAYDKKYETHGISILFRPFSFQLWMALISWIGISTVSITIIYYFIDKSPMAILNGLYEPLESFLNQCGYDPPRSFTLGIMTIASRLAALFIVSAYTGAILSFILIPKFKFPFKDLKEFVEDGTYKLGYMKSLLPLAIYSKWTKDWYLKTAYEKLSVSIDKETFYESIAHALDRMCDDHKFTFVHLELTDPTIRNLEKEFGYCKIKKNIAPICPSWIAMSLREGSPYVKIFNRILKTLKSSGVFKRIENNLAEYKNNSKLIKWGDNQDINNVVEISSLGPIFITVAILYVISVIIFVSEIIVVKLKKYLEYKRNH